MQARHYSVRNPEKQRQNYLKLVASANLVFMVLICKLPLSSSPQKEITRCKIETSRRKFFWSFLSFVDRAS